MNLEKAIDEVILDNLYKVTAYMMGDDRQFGFFVGQVMKKTGGAANPKTVNEMLKARLHDERPDRIGKFLSEEISRVTTGLGQPTVSVDPDSTIIRVNGGSFRMQSDDIAKSSDLTDLKKDVRRLHKRLDKMDKAWGHNNNELTECHFNIYKRIELLENRCKAYETYLKLERE